MDPVGCRRWASARASHLINIDINEHFYTSNLDSHPFPRSDIPCFLNKFRSVGSQLMASFQAITSVRWSLIRLSVRVRVGLDQSTSLPALENSSLE